MLRQAFRGVVTRNTPHSDRNFSLEGKRYEIPSRYRFMQAIRVQYARWHLNSGTRRASLQGVVISR